MIHEIKVPEGGESVTEAYIGEWSKADGEYVKKGEVIVDLESQKANFELESEFNGQIRILFPEEGTAVQTGAVIATIDDSIAEKDAKPSPKSNSTEETSATQTTANGAAAAAPILENIGTPSQRKTLTEGGIDPRSVAGVSWDGNLIPAGGTPQQTRAAEPEPIEVPIDEERGDKVKKATRMRREIAKNLVQAQRQAAILTTFNEVDMSAIMDFRKANKEKYMKEHGAKLGMASFFAVASAKALMEFPEVNAYYNGEKVIYHPYVDLSVAVSTEKGLVVPVIRDIHEMNLVSFEQALNEVSAKARDGKLSVPEMTGGTFTVSNGGVFGSLLSTPILNMPQTAILGLHKIEKRAVVIDDKIEIRPMMYLALSYDHRLIDGKEAVRFLVRVKELLENLDEIVG